MTYPRFVKILCLVLCCVLLAGCGRSVGESGPATPGSPEAETDSAGDEQSAVQEIEHKELPYPPIRIYKGPLLWDRGFVCDGKVYLPMRLFCEELGIDPVTVYNGETLLMQTQGLELSARSGDDYIKVNGRYVFSPDRFVMVGDEPYIPADTAEAIFLVTVTAAEDMSGAELDLSSLGIISGGEQYYTLNFDSEDVFWLSQLIYAEAESQMLEGRIAVGNVVLNRVAHEDYPDTIREVIFDTRGGVQFDTTLGDAIHRGADELSVIAAYMALDGVNTAGNSLFFVNPSEGDDSWFRRALEYVDTIGEHDFYTIKGA